MNRALRTVLSSTLPLAACGTCAYSAPAPEHNIETGGSTKAVATKKPMEPDKELMRKHRFVYLTGRIDEKSSRRVVTTLLYLNSLSHTPITLMINSGGGSITEGMAIYDTMKLIDAPVQTLCCGRCSSMGAVLLAAGVVGQRKAMPNARVMIHEASRSTSKLQISDFELRYEELKKKNSMLIAVLAHDCGKSEEEMREIFGRDLHMSAQEAVKLGLIDAVVVQNDLMALFKQQQQKHEEQQSERENEEQRNKA